MNQKQRFTQVFTTVMAFVYALAGIYLLVGPQPYFSGSLKIIAAVLLIGYGGFRIYIGVIQFRNTNRDRMLMWFLFLLAAPSCSVGGGAGANSQQPDTLHVYVDESFKPVIEAGYEVFSAMDTIQTLQMHYVPEAEAIAAVVSHKGIMAIVSRKLNAEEMLVLQEQSYFPKQTKIAVDAIGIVVNPAVNDFVISMDALKKVLTGKITRWNELFEGGSNQPLRVLFDNPKSGIVRYATDSICGNDSLHTQAFAMDKNTDVIDFVSRNPDVIGLVGGSWICNRNDSSHLTFHSKVKVLAIDFMNGYYYPFQAYILDGMYPLTRDIWMINAEPNVGKATRFSNFMAGEKGQRIILKSGILPAVAPTRLVNIKSGF